MIVDDLDIAVYILSDGSPQPCGHIVSVKRPERQTVEVNVYSRPADFVSSHHHAVNRFSHSDAIRMALAGHISIGPRTPWRDALFDETGLTALEV